MQLIERAFLRTMPYILHRCKTKLLDPEDADCIIDSLMEGKPKVDFMEAVMNVGDKLIEEDKQNG